MFMGVMVVSVPEKAAITLSWARVSGYSIFVDASDDVPRIYVRMDMVSSDFSNFFFNFFSNLAFSGIFDLDK